MNVVTVDSQPNLSLLSDAVRRNRNSTALRPFWEFAVHLGGTVKSVLVPLSAIGRISVPTRWSVQVQLYEGS